MNWPMHSKSPWMKGRSESLISPTQQIDTARVAMYRVCMKTISLSDEAYDRLKSWKVGKDDSFSKVVLKKVPKRGTAADMLQAVETLPELDLKAGREMEQAVDWANQWPHRD